MRFAPAAAVVVVLASNLFASCGPRKGSHDEEGGFPVTTKPALSAEAAAAVRATHAIKTVWVIVMENHNWKDVHGSPSAPYLNGTLLSLGAHAERYSNPKTIHPSEPNYIWLEAGGDLDISDDDDPEENYRTTKNHLSRWMDQTGVTWRAFAEGIDGATCPVGSHGRYAAKHVPFVFFDDVTDGRNPSSAYCLEHVRPYGELETRTAQYNFITPDTCNDMHDDEGCASIDRVANGDVWLAREVPKILASQAYRDGGAIFITWDENEGDEGDLPIGLIALSPFAKPGYANTIAYSHSSLIRTVQEIFEVRPYLRDAEHATSLSDLFTQYP